MHRDAAMTDLLYNPRAVWCRDVSQRGPGALAGRGRAVAMATARTGPIVVVDNYDSFTYNLVQVSVAFGCPTRPLPALRGHRLHQRDRRGRSTWGTLAASSRCSRTTRRAWRR